MTKATLSKIAVSHKWVCVGGAIAALVALAGVPMYLALAVAGVAAAVVVALSLSAGKKDDATTAEAEKIAT